MAAGSSPVYRTSKDVYSKPSFRRLWVRAPRKAPFSFFGGIGLRVWLKIKLFYDASCYIGDCCNGSKTGFDPGSGGPTPSSPAKRNLTEYSGENPPGLVFSADRAVKVVCLIPLSLILPFSLIGKTPVSEAGFLGSSPGGAAKSKSKMDRPLIRLWKRVGCRIRSVHHLKSGAMRTADLWCKNTLLAVCG